MRTHLRYIITAMPRDLTVVKVHRADNCSDTLTHRWSAKEGLHHIIPRLPSDRLLHVLQLLQYQIELIPCETGGNTIPEEDPRASAQASGIPGVGGAAIECFRLIISPRPPAIFFRLF